MVADAKSETHTTGSSSLAGNQHDYGTNRAQDVDKDTGTDERYEVESADRSSMTWLNGKRDFDSYGSIDKAAAIDAQKYKAALENQQLADMEQRRRHLEAEFNQRMRHADRMDAISNSTIAALLGDMAEKLGEVYQATVKKP